MVGTGTNQYKARNTDASAEPTQTPQIGQLHVQVESPNFGWPFLQKIDIFFFIYVELCELWWEWEIGTRQIGNTHGSMYR